MGEYENTLENIKKSCGFVPGFMKALPKDAIVKDWPLLKKYQMEESVVPKKYRELIGFAVAANLKCPYCLLMHTAMATGYGATSDEISEVAVLAGQTAKWSAMLHALQYNYDTFLKESTKLANTPKKPAKK